MISNKTASCNYAINKKVTVNPLPIASITNLSNKRVSCENDTIKLKSTDALGNLYQWNRDTKPIANATKQLYGTLQTGSYTVLVTNEYKCTALSDSLNFVFNPVPKGVVFDSIPLYCGGKTAIISLVASPKGGIFDGIAVAGSEFDAG